MFKKKLYKKQFAGLQSDKVSSRACFLDVAHIQVDLPSVVRLWSFKKTAWL